MFNRMDISKGGFKPPLLTTLCFTLVAWSISAHSQPDSLWTRYYNDGESGYRETCQELIRTTDGGFMIGGRCYSEAEDLRPQWFQDYYLVKVDSIGTEQWSRAYDLSHRHESFGDVVQTPDEEYLIVGESHNGRYANILRINSDSDTSWSRYYGDGELREIISMPDGTAVAAGQTSEFAEFGGADAYLVKIDEEGEVIWRGVYGGRAHDLFSSIKNHDGGFLATGLAWMVAGILAKIDSTGELEWLHYINPTDGADALNDFTVLFDGTIIAVGYADSRDGLLVKCNSEGELVWSRIYEDNDSIHDIVPLCGGGYVLICGSRAFRIDDLGDEIWEIEAEQFDFDYFHCILPMDDGGY
ncbi:hypothetical protein K9N50_13415, partial [bacterium]|nr:hypothetical protein [bacterium]